MRRHTVIDLRSDGAYVVPDPGATLINVPTASLLVEAGASPRAVGDPIYVSGVAAGLGAFFDALVDKTGCTREAAQEILWVAYENLKLRAAA